MSDLLWVCEGHSKTYKMHYLQGDTGELMHEYKNALLLMCQLCFEQTCFGDVNQERCNSTSCSKLIIIFKVWRGATNTANVPIRVFLRCSPTQTDVEPIYIFKNITYFIMWVREQIVLPPRFVTKLTTE